ncbi:protein glucosyltransferase [Apostasia shenzhenica]|uniref:Protein glucosyltransferase n=1 Tax=Apostasia shenzhenica TaxID=1088818 RepID=A0A2I0AUX5_9ASPA|nr:protein glucosyltransferase [Apostasia shenzhenica]
MWNDLFLCPSHCSLFGFEACQELRSRNRKSRQRLHSREFADEPRVRLHVPPAQRTRKAPSVQPNKVTKGPWAVCRVNGPQGPWAVCRVNGLQGPWAVCRVNGPQGPWALCRVNSLQGLWAAHGLSAESMARKAYGTAKEFMTESIVKSPHGAPPCTLPPPFSGLELNLLLRRKRNSVLQVEKWEQSAWERRAANF